MTQDLTVYNPDIEPGNPQTIAESLLPVSFDKERQRRYLSFRACGFSIREACKLTGVPEGTVRYWRHSSPDYAKTEIDAVTVIREKLAAEHINLEFTRNYALILTKDFRVIQKSLNTEEQLTSKEHDYLLKARSHYTPQQLAILHQLLGKGDGGEKSFADLVKELATVDRDRISLKREEMIIERG